MSLPYGGVGRATGSWVQPPTLFGPGSKSAAGLRKLFWIFSITSHSLLWVMRVPLPQALDSVKWYIYNMLRRSRTSRAMVKTPRL